MHFGLHRPCGYSLTRSRMSVWEVRVDPAPSTRVRCGRDVAWNATATSTRPIVALTRTLPVVPRSRKH